jgi:hypothetical protein
MIAVLAEICQLVVLDPCVQRNLGKVMLETVVVAFDGFLLLLQESRQFFCVGQLCGEHSKLLLGLFIDLGHKLRNRVHFRLLVSHGYISRVGDVPGRGDCESGRGGGCHCSGLKISYRGGFVE